MVVGSEGSGTVRGKGRRRTGSETLGRGRGGLRDGGERKLAKEKLQLREQAVSIEHRCAVPTGLQVHSRKVKLFVRAGWGEGKTDKPNQGFVPHCIA
jgi:hypothetical protein